MSTTNQVVVQKRHIILVAIAAFGGMITAMLATLAITVPVMSAQASSLLDQQAKQFAQVMTAQNQTGSAKQAAAGFDFSQPIAACAEPGGGQGGAGAGGAAVMTAGAINKFDHQPSTKAVSHAMPAKLVSEKKLLMASSTVNNYDNDVFAVNSFNTNNVDVSTKGDHNNVDVTLEANNSFKAEVNHGNDKNDHDRKDSNKGHGKHESKKDNKGHNDHKKHDNKKDRHDEKDNHKKKDDHKKGDWKKDHDRKDQKHDKNDDRKHEDRKDDSDRKDDKKDHKGNHQYTRS